MELNRPDRQMGKFWEVYAVGGKGGADTEGSSLSFILVRKFLFCFLSASWMPFHLKGIFQLDGKKEKEEINLFCSTSLLAYRL